MDWTLLAPMLVEHLAVPALVALGGWLVTKIPGPLKTWLQADTHAKDMALLIGALGRGALAAYGDYNAGRLTTAGAAIQQIVTYVLRAIPDTVTKLGPPPDVLTTMAHATWDKLMVQVKAGEVQAQ
jgi:hypothetical protein